MSQPDSVPQPKRSESKLAVFLKEIYGIWIGERPSQFAAALAYYAIFSLAPWPTAAVRSVARAGAGRC